MTRTCEECGASWGREARWCATCGQALVEVEPTAGPMIEADDDRLGSVGRWRRWAMGVGLLTVVVAGGVLAGQQVTGDGAEDDVSGGIGLPESEPPEPDARQAAGGDGQALGRDLAEPITCTRDGVEIPACPRLLRTGLDMVAPPTGDLVFERASRWTIQAIDVTTGDVRWVMFRPGDRILLTGSLGADTLLLTSQGLRRVDPDGVVRWQVQDVSADDMMTVEASEAGTLVILDDGANLVARSAADGSLLWTVPEPVLELDPSRDRYLHLVGAAGTSLLFEVQAEGGHGGIVAALDGITGELLWELPAQQVGPGTVAQVAHDGVLLVAFDEGNGPPEQYDLVVRDPRTGTVLWERRYDFASGFNLAAAVGHGLVVVSVDGRLQALHLATGELAWETDGATVFRPTAGSRPFWAPTPTPDEGPIVVHRAGRLERLDPNNGRVLWSVDSGSRADFGVVSSTRAMRFSFGSGGPRVSMYDVSDGSEIATIDVEPSIVSLDPLVILDQDRLLLVPDEVEVDAADS